MIFCSQKLYTYGIHGTPFKWFKSYLRNHTQFVKIYEIEPSMETIKCGVPQGSALKPFLFLLYINDLPNSSEKLCFRIFADDTNISFPVVIQTRLDFLSYLQILRKLIILIAKVSRDIP